jgi:hypothetical protein
VAGGLTVVALSCGFAIEGIDRVAEIICSTMTLSCRWTLSAFTNASISRRALQERIPL